MNEAVTRRRNTRGSMFTAAFSIVATIICAAPAAMVGFALGDFPTRMVCTPETGYGSGCDEGFLLFAGIFFLALFVPAAFGSASLTLTYRHYANRGMRWWPFTLLVAVTLLIVAVFGISVLLDPHAQI